MSLLKGLPCFKFAPVIVYLHRALEELDGVLVLLLVGEAVAGGAPGRGRELVDPLKVLGQGRQLHLFLQVPEGGAVVLHQLQAVGILLPHQGKVAARLLVLVHLEVALAEGGPDPGRAAVRRWQ